MLPCQRAPLFPIPHEARREALATLRRFVLPGAGGKGGAAEAGGSSAQPSRTVGARDAGARLSR
jgi:hypothetical protein